jgi:hypothetical protein
VDLNLDQPALEQEIRAARTLEAMEAAFVKVERLTATVQDPALYGRKLFTGGLDRVATYLAGALGLADAPRLKSNDNVCILATQFYATGGHTRVARDFAAGLPPDKKPLLILTNGWGGKSLYRGLVKGGKLQSALGERALLLLSAPTLVEKTLELYMMLKAVNASRIVLICHPFDIVAIVASWPFRDVVELVHHADHVPALGASLPWSAHVDVTYTCHCACRASGLDAVYAGLTSPTVHTPTRLRDPTRLRLATCGDQRKYNGEALTTWTEYAVAAMRQPEAEMLHIGDMSAEFQQGIHDALSAAGLDPARYVFTGSVPSLPAALLEDQTDVYISSYPTPGGKANLEAMAVGTPVILPVDSGMPPLMHFRLPLAHYVEVHAPSEMTGAIASAIALGEQMRSPPAIELRDRELGRFAEFVAGRRPPETSLVDVLTE